MKVESEKVRSISLAFSLLLSLLPLIARTRFSSGVRGTPVAHSLQSFQQKNLAFCGVSLEQRKAVRFQMRAPVIFRWSDQSGTKQESVGRTRDISIAGVFVTCPNPLPVGTPISLEVHLSPLENTRHRLRLEATGKIVRVGNGEESGFAVISRFDLHEVAVAAS